MKKNRTSLKEDKTSTKDKNKKLRKEKNEKIKEAKDQLAKILSRKYDYFVTFTFNSSLFLKMSPDEGTEVFYVQKQIGAFKKRIHKKLFSRQPLDLDFIPFIETRKFDRETKTMKRIRPHIHILISRPPKTARLKSRFDEFLLSNWLEMKCSGSKNLQKVQLIKTKEDQKRYIKYSLKTLIDTYTDCFDVINYHLRKV